MRQNRTVVIDFGVSLQGYRSAHANTRWFLGKVVLVMRVAMLALHRVGCPLTHRYTRHSKRDRSVLQLHGTKGAHVPVSQIRCLDCGAVFTVLPSFLLRYIRFEVHLAQAVLEYNLIMNVSFRFQSRMLENLSPAVSHGQPMSLWGLMRWLGASIPVTTLLLKLGLTPPAALLEDEKFVSEAGRQTYIAAIVRADLIWWIDYLPATDEATMTQAIRGYASQIAALLPAYAPEVATVDGHNPTQSALMAVFPGVHLQECTLHSQRQLAADLVTYQRRHDGVDEALLHKVSESTWAAMTASGSLRQCSQRLRRVREFIEKTLPDSTLLTDRMKRIYKKRHRLTQYLHHPEAAKTSTPIDHVFKWLDRKFYQMQSFMTEVGGQAFSNAWAIARNFWRFMPGAKRAGASPVELNGVDLCGKAWLEVVNLLAHGGLSPSMNL